MTRSVELRPRSQLSILTHLLLLLGATVVIIQATNAAILLAVGPPVPEFHSVGSVVGALNGDQASIRRHGFRLTLRASLPRTLPALPPFGGRRRQTLSERVRDRIAAEFKVSSANVRAELFGPPFVRTRSETAPAPAPPAIGPASAAAHAEADDLPVIAPFTIAVRQADGRWRVLESAKDPLPNAWQKGVLIWLALTASLIGTLAWFYARRLATPIRDFASAAERVGREHSRAPLEIRGPTEIQVAQMAVNQMQQRLERYVDDRTSMVAAIAHDLRGPLARMKLLLEAQGDLRASLNRQVDEMDDMIASTLAFARDASLPGPRVALDLSSLVETLVEDASDAGRPVTLGDCEAATIKGDPLALRRLLGNLIDNALRYSDHATVSLRAGDELVWIDVCDNGPGIPEHELARVFEPFYRPESSRNRGTGGIGLGLAVVRSIALSHGGDVVLENLQPQGLRAGVSLPLQRGGGAPSADRRGSAASGRLSPARS